LVTEAEFSEFDRLLTVQKLGSWGKVHDYVLSSGVSGNITLLHAPVECLDDISRLVDENCRVAPMRENSVWPPVTDCLAESDEQALNS